MKKTLLVLLFVVLVSVTGQAANRIARLEAQRQPSFHPPRIEAVKLSNGILCYFLTDRQLPIVQVKLFVRGGSVHDDNKKVGVGQAMAALLREGGTKKHEWEELNRLLDENAIDISFGTAPEMINGGLGVLSKDMDTALEFFFEMIFEPAFDDGRLENVKGRMIEGVRRENDSISAISHREFKKLVYGPESPWARTPKISDIKKISKADVEDYYSRFFYTDRMILAVSGDFDRSGLIKKLEKLTGGHKKSNGERIIPPPVDAQDAPKIKRISKNFTQAAINVGHLGSTRNNPDKYAIILLNYILGDSGSFNSHLQDTIRVKNGLAYEVWSAYSFGPDGAPGLFQIHAKTKSKTAGDVAKYIEQEVRRLVDGGISEEEFKKAKDGILNKFIFEYETSQGIVSATAGFVYFGYPENYLELYKKGIETATLADVKAAAVKYLHPDKLKMLVVGKGSWKN